LRLQHLTKLTCWPVYAPYCALAKRDAGLDEYFSGEVLISWLMTIIAQALLMLLFFVLLDFKTANIALIVTYFAFGYLLRWFILTTQRFDISA
jgi:hypothetical protein